MEYGIIKIPVTDLRGKPDSESERVSQALFGYAVEIGKSQNGFCRITLLDKYKGWCREAHVARLSKPQWEKYKSASRQKIKSESVIIKSGPSLPAFPFRLFFGTELVIKSRNGLVHFELPGCGIRAPISTRDLKPARKKNEAAITGKKLVKTASRFIGVPYLWGGITPCGFDCSGLVQAVYGFHGITMPRDSKAQRNEGLEVNRDDLQPGDLLFFPGHVAISCGGKSILHASASRGMVTFDSLDSNDDNYREDLDKSCLFAKRLPL